MKKVIIISKKDPASLNIREELDKIDIKTQEIEQEPIYAENIDKKIDADFFIFATKHRSEKGVNSLSIHTPGNWNKADLGGKEKTLCTSSALLQKIAFLKLNELAKNTNYEVTLECTHHGPFLEKPCMFIEIGSSLEQWKDKNAAQIIAKTIQYILEVNKNSAKKNQIAIGLGGPHYSNTFNKILLRTNIATSHICPKHMLPYLTEDLLKQAIKRTQEKVDFILLDWKGLGTEKTRIINLLKELNLDYKKSKEVLE